MKRGPTVTVLTAPASGKGKRADIRAPKSNTLTVHATAVTTRPAHSPASPADRRGFFSFITKYGGISAAGSDISEKKYAAPP